jgi:Uma2 family endonuclease
MAVMAIAVTPTDTEPVSEPTSAPARGAPGDQLREPLDRFIGGLVLSGRPLTWHDLQQLPDGLRYELVDGVLLVSPAPIFVHQRVVQNVAYLLHRAGPAGFEVLPAPVDWYVSEYTVFEPDLLVARIDDPLARRLETTPLLAVEVLSPSTRLRDLGLKRRAYEDAGLPWYWVIDPDLDEPRLTVYRLEGGRCVEDAVVVGDDGYTAEEPVKVEIVPRRLVEAPP